MSTLLSPFTALGSAFRRRSATEIARETQGQAFTPIRDAYAMRLGYYASTVYNFDQPGSGTLKADEALYRNIRSVLPIAFRAVNWWRGNLYPGIWTSDGRPSNNGTPNRIPWEDDVPDELVGAAQQAFTWGNWQSQIGVWSFFGPLYGDVFVEIESDPVRQKVYPIVHDPACVVDLEFNRSGDVIVYELEIPTVDRVRKRSFLWGKRVTQDEIITYYDRKEASINGQPARQPNPWGFVPAVWWMFRDVGGDHGAPVTDGLYPLFNEINASQSAVDDFILKFVMQKIIVGSDDPGKLATILAAAQKMGSTDDFTNPNAFRETLPILPGPPNVTVARLLENLGLGEATAHIERLMKAVEWTLPEVVVEEKMADLGQLTGPGARSMAAPAQRKLDEGVGGSDHHLVKAGQMCLSIGGEEANSGRWGLRSQLTEQQQMFLPFNLQSWSRGELKQLSISPRSLVQETMLEKAQEAAAVNMVETEWGLRHVGLSSAEIHGTKPDGTPIEQQGSVGILAERQARADAAVASF